MKHLTYKRSLALLLMLCLLFVCIPAVTAEEPEMQSRRPMIQLLTEPKYAVGFNEFYGSYCKFNDYNSNFSGICDCFGNVTMSGKNLDLEPLENGMAKEMGRNEQGYIGWAILSPTGKRLTPYTSGGEVGCAKDWYTGQIYNWVCADFLDEGERRIDFNGNDPFAGRYDDMSIIFDGKFAYSKNGKCGVDDLSGRQLLPCKYEYLDMVWKDVCLFEEGGKYGLLGTDGTVLIPAKYDEIGAAPDGSCYIVTEDGKQGLYDASFRQTMPCIYQELDCLSDELACERTYVNSDVTATINLMRTDGTLLRSFTGGYIQKMYEDDTHSLFCYFGPYNGGKEQEKVLMDERGQVLLEKPGFDLTVTKELVFLFTAQGAEVYDHDLQLLNVLEGAKTTYGDYPLVYKDGYRAFVGSDGKLLTDYVFEEIERTFHDGTVCLKKDGKWNIFAEDATPLLDFWLDVAPRFSESSDYAGYRVSGYEGILRFVLEDDSLFADVKNDAWYRTAADYCAETGLMAGTAPGKFSPDVTTTRAMLVTILYSMTGAEAPAGDNPFTDVKDGQWYTPAVLWASENGIVSGYGNGKFGPNDPVTREQIAAILCSHAAKFGMGTSGSKDLGTFPDAAKVSTWAKDAVSWAVANGLISGSAVNGKTLLDPQGKATRAMVACIMMRFAQLAA